MNIRNCVGVALCSAVFLGSFLLVGGIAMYWNLAAFLVVFSGLAAAVLLSYPFDRVQCAVKVAKNAYLSRPAAPEDMVRTLLDLSVRSRVKGVLSLEKLGADKLGAHADRTFLQNGVNFLVDNYKEEEIRDFLGTEMAFFAIRRRHSERVFQTMARIAPAFGLAGSVIGLIGLLMGINDTAVILQSIPVAFISTLYGVVLSNLVFAPIAENIHFTTSLELLNQKLVMEGIIAISREQNPFKLERKLASFLTPSARSGYSSILREITRKYIREKRGEAAVETLAAADTVQAGASALREVMLHQAS